MRNETTLSVLYVLRKGPCLAAVIGLMLQSAVPLLQAQQIRDDSEARSEEKFEAPTVVPTEAIPLVPGTRVPTRTPVKTVKTRTPVPEPTQDPLPRFELERLKDTQDLLKEKQERLKENQDRSREDQARVSEKLDALSSDLSVLQKKMSKGEENSRLAAEALDDLKTNLNSIDKKMEQLSADLQKQKEGALRKEDLSELQTRFQGLRDEVSGTVEKLKDMRSDYTKGLDQMAGLSDTLAVLKKDLSDHGADIATLKREIKLVSSGKTPDARQGGGGTEEPGDILTWPYWGVCAAVISVIAVIVASQPKQ